MIIPIKCFTCGNVLADKYEYYKEHVREEKLKKDLDGDKVILLFEELVIKYNIIVFVVYKVKILYIL